MELFFSICCSYNFSAIPLSASTQVGAHTLYLLKTHRKHSCHLAITGPIPFKLGDNIHNSFVLHSIKYDEIWYCGREARVSLVVFSYLALPSKDRDVTGGSRYFPVNTFT